MILDLGDIKIGSICKDLSLNAMIRKSDVKRGDIFVDNKAGVSIEVESVKGSVSLELNTYWS